MGRRNRKPDARRLEKTNLPGVYRRHAQECTRKGRCHCPYVVRWWQGGSQHKQMFATYELAKEFKGGLDSGRTSRRPLSSETVAGYYETWLANFRGRTARGLEETTGASTRSASGCTSCRWESPG